MRNTTRQTRENRTITIDFQNEATYVQLPGFSANNPPLHAHERARKSSPGAGLRADGGG
jgi:hypothetical protein